MTSSPRVLVIGAGLAGLACARSLVDRGMAVTVVDKGRRPGGRACSRTGFDHGAQFFTARGEWLQRQVASWEASGVVARWQPRIVQTDGARARDDAAWWVGTPSMGALAEHLARGLHVEQERKVTALSRSPDGAWSLAFEAGTPVRADAVVVAVPAAQAAVLLAEAHGAFAEIARSVAQTPCWAVMLAVRGQGDLGADVFEDGRHAIAWAAREASKPERIVDDEERWVLHASPAWSLAHLEDDESDVARHLSEAFLARHGRGEIVRARAHRWRFALGHLPDRPGALFDADARLAVCGDAFNGSRIEGALTSGLEAAGHLARAYA